MPLAGERIEGAERLVEQHHARLSRERTGDADALLLAAGELGGPAVADERRIELDHLEQLVDTLPAMRSRVPAEQRRSDRDVLRDGHVREEADLLEDVADLAPQHVGLHGGGVFAVEQHAARRRLDEPVDHLERGGLAGARAAQQHQQLALLDT